LRSVIAKPVTPFDHAESSVLLARMSVVRLELSPMPFSDPYRPGTMHTVQTAADYTAPPVPSRPETPDNKAMPAIFSYESSNELND